ncbi:hypothetical protein QBC45DRAFT_332953, partial [Copromyces sp. CBS 386.78]
IGRVNRVFKQDYYTKSYIFILVTPVERTNIRHPILNLKIIKETINEPLIISLTAIQPVKLYIVYINSIRII